MVSPPFPKARVLQRTLEPGPSWCLYCTLRHLPLVARPVDVCASRQRDSDGLAAQPLVPSISVSTSISPAPPPSPWPQTISLAPLRPKGVTHEPPFTIPSPSLSRWQLSSGKRASCGVNGTFWVQRRQGSYRGFAADVLDFRLHLHLIQTKAS